MWRRERKRVLMKKIKMSDGKKLRKAGKNARAVLGYRKVGQLERTSRKTGKQKGKILIRFIVFSQETR